jgi:outer membrane protein assembly factor BamD
MLGCRTCKIIQFLSPYLPGLFLVLHPMNKAFIITGLLAALLLGACSKEYRNFSTLSRKGNLAEKDSAAFFFYKRGDYEKASYLFEELRGAYRGTERAKTMLYHFAYCKYHTNLFSIAAYYFEEYVKQYPTDALTSECSYMIAYCFYLESAPYNLDQSANRKAMSQFQLFVNNYPYHEKVEESNRLMTDLRERLARKEFEEAKLYYKVENYKAAVTALSAMIQTYPDSRYREEAQFLLFKSAVFLGDYSIADKQKNRYLDAIELYQRFVDKYPSSVYVKEAEEYYLKAKKSLGKLTAEAGKS